MEKVRVRFAPSPTGPLHMGGVRTALFNYLFARKYNGSMILRIEDTDRNRYVEGAEQYIMEALNWCGIEIDEGVQEGGKFGPYRQSERSSIYRKYADALIENGWAYVAFDSPESLQSLREKAESQKQTFTYDHTTRHQLDNSLNIGMEAASKRMDNGESYVVRFKMPENKTLEIRDIIRGDMHFNTGNLDDKVLFKSDGLPTYHLANIVDDHLMEITHVIRGEEWLPSLPLHVMLYHALGWNTPEFVHLPLILKPTGKGKLSKRDGDKMGFPVFPIEWKTKAGDVFQGYRENGYYPEAFVNILALLGWNPGTDKELFSIDELITHFDLDKVNKAGARFDPEKATWFNHQYLIRKSNHDIAEEFMPMLNKKGYHPDMDRLTTIVGMVKERVSFASELWEQTDFFFEAPTEYHKKFRKKAVKNDTPEILQSIRDVLSAQDDFLSVNLENKVKTWIENNELGFGKVMNPLRLALVGEGKGPHVFDILEVLGKEESLKRIDDLLKNIQS
ncbi:MAG: glutamate--tRNA ligase [Bacteroidota bacterium]|nr:glutamate--tRNA ligase [Bacteroidota bacterium]